jgi:V/A-type H+-transporting ATPase subunit G/H
LLGEVIKEIRAAEQKAEEIKQHAQAEARRIIREAELRAAEIVEKSVAEAEAEGRQQLAAVEAESDTLTAPIRERTAAEIELLVAAARDKQEDAITMVMERIVKSYEHS